MDVTAVLQAAINNNFSYFVIQGRVNESLPGPTSQRGLQIYSTATSHSAALNPQLNVSYADPAPFDLKVSVTESSDPAVAGSGSGNLTYLVTVTNLGPFAASGVVVNDVLSLPTGVSLFSPPSTSLGTFTNPTWTVGSLAVGASETLTIVLTVGSSTAAGADVISNTATFTATDTNSANNSDTEATSVIHTVDLAVSVSESVDPVVAGSGVGNLTYVVTVANVGSNLATGVVVNDVLSSLPTGVSLVSATASTGLGTFISPTWTVGSLAAGASATLTFVLTVDGTAAAGLNAISNTATLSAVSPADTNSTNNSDTEATSVIDDVDLAVSMTESVDPVIAGSGMNNLTYVVTVQNIGDDSATGVALQDVLTIPSGVSASITPSAGSFSSPTWTVGTLLPGASATLTIVLTVGSGAAPGLDVISNVATVSSLTEIDIIPGNDAAAHNTSIIHPVDLAVSVSESSDPVLAGSGLENLTYFVTVTNVGVGNATGVVVTDVLSLPPAGVSLVSATASTGPGTFSSPTWTVGSLASGASATLTIVLTVDRTTTGGANVISNTATVTLIETDTYSANNSDTEATSVTPPVDVAVSVLETADPVVAGSGSGNLTYVVTVTNAGTDAVTGVVVNDELSLPAGVSLVSASPSTGLGTFTAPTWTVGSLAAGGSATLTIVLTVGGSTAAGADSVRCCR